VARKGEGGKKANLCIDWPNISPQRQTLKPKPANCKISRMNGTKLEMNRLEIELGPDRIVVGSARSDAGARLVIHHK